MMTRELDKLFAKAEKNCPFYATTPVESRIDPRMIQASGKYGDFMRLPLKNGLNRWCFENAAMRDSFLHDYANMGAKHEDTE